MRSLIIAVVALSLGAAAFASGANAAQFDYFNKTHPLAANTHGNESSGAGAGKTGPGGGRVSAHCAPGAKGKACHRA